MSSRDLIPTFSIVVSLKGDHNRASPTPSTQTETEPPPASKLSHIDRDSAVALGVILILILAASAWYVHLHIKHKREVEMERQLELERRQSVRQYGAQSRHTNTYYGNVSNVRVGFRTSRLWSKSNSTLGGGSVSTQGTQEKQKRFSWPRRWSSSGSTRVGSSSDRVVTPHELEECPFHPSSSRSTSNAGSHYQPRPRSRSPSPHSTTRPIPYYCPTPPPSSASPTRSQHRRKSSVHSVPEAFLAEAQTRRPSSAAGLSQNQVDKRWWTDVARRGSSARADQRFSRLASIPEPEVPDHECRPFSHESMGGNSREGEVSYAWTRPGSVIPDVESDGEEQHEDAETGGGFGGKAEVESFRGVVWDTQAKDKQLESKASAKARANDGVQTVDWAKEGSTDIRARGDACRQTR